MQIAIMLAGRPVHTYLFLGDFGLLFLKLPETNINITTITESSRNEKNIVHMNLGKIGLFSLIHAYAV